MSELYKNFPTVSNFYHVVYADPPWKYNDSNCRGAAEKHYKTLSFDELSSLPVFDICTTNSFLFMWATCPLLYECLKLGKMWGFTYKTVAFQWVKTYLNTNKIFVGLGHYTRSNTEPLLLFTKGKPKCRTSRVSQVIHHQILPHSEKPSIIRAQINRLVDDDANKIELFARRKINGWHCWGNEVSST